METVFQREEDVRTRGLPCHPPSWMAWSVWTVAALFYLAGFYQRVAPAVMTGELMKEFHIAAAGLGNLSAFYYYSYVAMQIPTGLLADFWGPRKLLTAGVVVATIGTLVFAVSYSLVLANLGRALIGGSVGVAFVTSLKLASHWLPPRLFAASSGLTLLFGVLGAVTAGVPLRYLIDHFGWRPVMVVSGGFTLGLALFSWMWIRDDPSARGFLSYSSTGSKSVQRLTQRNPFRALTDVFSYRNPCLLFVIPGGLAGPVLTFAGLWGVPFLGVKFGLSPSQAAGICSVMMVCWAVGGPILGGLSDRIGRRKPLYIIGCLVAALAWAAVIYIEHIPFGFFVGLIALIGFASGVVVIGFAFAKESVPGHLSGTIAGTTNMGTMMGPTLLQPAVGWVLDRMWTGQMLGGVRVYDLSAFQNGFLLMFGWSVLSCILASLMKETYCRPYE